MATAECKAQDSTKQATVFHQILVATDFSDAWRRALSEALVLASDKDAKMTLVHVAHTDWRYEMLDTPPEFDLEQGDARRGLEKLIDSLHSEKKIEAALLKAGPVAATVADLARVKGADLIVVGTRGLGGFAKLALGSVAEELLRIAPCPVMTMGPHSEITAAGFRRILFATDFGKGSTKAMPLALALAREHRARLILLHMLSPMPVTTANLSAYAPAPAAADEIEGWEETSRKLCLRQLRECLPAEIDLEETPEYVVGTDLLPEGILIAAEKLEVDLIVMGANRTGFARVAAHIPWTAVHEVARNARCPVLTVAG
ncbi:MAG TPA: universal stress protein [Candidatus Dormibacteraeota bacterium]|nr:universal stress protein [Candidatus Dormibacteraeota bacterium]